MINIAFNRLDDSKIMKNELIINNLYYFEEEFV